MIKVTIISNLIKKKKNSLKKKKIKRAQRASMILKRKTKKKKKTLTLIKAKMLTLSKVLKINHQKKIRRKAYLNKVKN